MAKGRKDSEESSSLEESDNRTQSSGTESDSVRSRSKERKREKKSKKKSKKASKDRKKKSSKKSSHRSSSRSRSREKKKKRKDSLDSRDSKRSKKKSRSRSPVKSSRRRSRSPPRRSARSRSADRSRSRRSPERRRSPVRRRSPPRERYRSRSSRDRSRDRDRRISTASSRSDYIRKRSPPNRTREIKTFAPKCDLSALKVLPGGSTYKPEMNEEQMIQTQLNNFKSKTDIENESPRKRKPTFQVSDFFGRDSDSESDGQMASPTSRLPSSDGFEQNAKWKAVVPPATQVGPPKLTRAPNMESHADPAPVIVPAVAQMPHLIPMPGMDIEEDSVFDDTEIKTGLEEANARQEINSDIMDISDSDNNEEINEDQKTLMEAENPQSNGSREPPPLLSRPPPPLRRRISRFSTDQYPESPPETGPPKLEPAPGALEETSPAREPTPRTTKFNAEHSPPNLPNNVNDRRKRAGKAPPVPKFTLLKEPLYHCNKDFVRAGKDTQTMDCECRLPDDKHSICCGEECLNRALMVECSNRCRTGNRCTNKNFQKRKYAPAKIFWAEGKGHGLKATAFIPRGKFIIEYLGEVVSAKEFKKRSHEYARSGKQHHYFMELSRQATIDAYQKGAISRFINHSCEPNSETQKWTVNGLLRIGFFAIRDIEPEEEITFDYQFIHFGQGQKCLCGAPSCRGIIGREAGQQDNRKTADGHDENYGKLILNTRRVDCSEDMEKLARNMSRTSSGEMKAKRKAIDLILNSSRKLQSVFMTNFGLEILSTYAKEDHLDNNAIKHDLLRLLGDLEISHRDKVEDNGLIAIIDKWSMIEDQYQEKSQNIVSKWRMLPRRVPIKINSTPSEDIEESPKQQSLPILTHRDSRRRRSPRLAPEKDPEMIPSPEKSPEMDVETRTKRKENHRRQFEETIKKRGVQEALFREIAKQNVDKMVLDAMQESEEESYHEEEGPSTRENYESPDEINPFEIEDHPSEETAEEQRDNIRKMLLNLKPSEEDEIILDGIGHVITKDEDGGLLLQIRANDIEELKQTWKDGKKFQELRDRDRAKREHEQKEAEAAEIERKNAQSMETTVAPADTTVANGDAVPDEMLPDGWKSHKDDEGATYYYHDKSRETTWDPPEMSAEEHELKAGKLRRMLYEFIAEVLLAYRDESANHGRITNDDDYQYLIRKLSSGLTKRITKELQTFRLTDQGRVMAAKYCHKYMTRQGECFVRRRDPKKSNSTASSAVL